MQHTFPPDSQLAERELKRDGAGHVVGPGGEGEGGAGPTVSVRPPEDPIHQKWAGNTSELKSAAEAMLGFFGELRGLAAECDGMVP